jgi:uncharacterized RDD family membrane protein YckC
MERNATTTLGPDAILGTEVCRAATPPRKGTFLTVQAASTALAPAAIGARVVAALIDGVILWIIQSIVGGILSDASVVGGFIRAIIAAVVAFAYFGYSWTAWRASPGQRLLGLMTVNEADGAALTRNEATVRFAYLFGPIVLYSLLYASQLGVLLFLFGLAVIGYYVYLLYTAATDPRKQGFHDRQSGTLVIAKTA